MFGMCLVGYLFSIEAFFFAKFVFSDRALCKPLRVVWRPYRAVIDTGKPTETVHERDTETDGGR